MTTDYRAMCVELLDALENAVRVIYHEDGTKHISTADTVIAKADAALAQPEPVAPTDEELVKHYDRSVTSAIDSRVAMHLLTDEDLDAATAAGLRAVLARWGRPAITPVPVAAASRQDPLDNSPAPADGLVEQVIKAQELINQYRIGGERLCAHAAVLAVAEWLEEHKFLTGACWLREEVERG